MDKECVPKILLVLLNGMLTTFIQGAAKKSWKEGAEAGTIMCNG
jgi:hypothetical protein